MQLFTVSYLNQNFKNTNRMATIFSRIISGEIPSYKVAEDDRFYAFLDVNPLKKGHTLVVPKQEVDYIFDLDDQTLGDMMVFAKKIAAKIQKSRGSRKVAVAVVGLEVPHAHIHLIPLDQESDIDFTNERLKLSPEEFTQITNSLL